jgi:anti-anti-sigma regulatory factor
MWNMEIASIQKLGHHLPVTILQLVGKLDGSNYMQLVEEAQRNYHNGVRDLLIDLSQLTYMSSLGITAIHETALLFRGLPIPEKGAGWTAYNAIERDRKNGVQKHVKLLSPQPDVAHILEIVGFKALFEIFTDLDTALASFQ